MLFTWQCLETLNIQIYNRRWIEYPLRRHRKWLGHRLWKQIFFFFFFESNVSSSIHSTNYPGMLFSLLCGWVSFSTLLLGILTKRQKVNGATGPSDCSTSPQVVQYSVSYWFLIKVSWGAMLQSTDKCPLPSALTPTLVFVRWTRWQVWAPPTLILRSHCEEADSQESHPSSRWGMGWSTFPCSQSWL